MPCNDITLFVLFLRWNSRTCGEIDSLIFKFRSSSCSMATISVMDRKLVRLYFKLQTLMLTCKAIQRCIMFFLEIVELDMSSSVITLFSAKRGTKELTSLVLSTF